MMGFKRERKLYKLKFADGELQGLEVTVRSLSIAQMLSLGNAPDGSDQAAATSYAESNIRLFADSLVEWNLEDEDGNQVPPTYDGVCGQDVDFLRLLIAEWSQALAGVPDPLPEGSTSGGISQLGSIPTESL